MSKKGLVLIILLVFCFIGAVLAEQSNETEQNSEINADNVEELINDLFNDQGDLTDKGVKSLEDINQKLNNAPTPVKMLLGDERININIFLQTGQIKTINLIVQNNILSYVKIGSISEETMNIAIEEQTINQILSSKSQDTEFFNAMMDGRIQIKTNSFISNIMLKMILTISNIKSFFTDIFAVKIQPSSEPVSDIICGNNQIDSEEECDGANLNEQTCQTFDYTYGVLACNADCTFDKTECAVIITETYNIGDTISDLKGRNNLAGRDDLSIKFANIAQTRPGGQYQGTFELYSDGSLIDTVTITPSNFLSYIFRDSSGALALETGVYVGTITAFVDGTDLMGSVNVTISRRG